MYRFHHFSAVLSAGLISLALSGCVTDHVTGRRSYNMYSMQQEVQMGRQTLDANTQQLKKAGVGVNKDPQKVAEINEMMRRIAKASDLPDLPYNVTLYHTNIVNAAAAPGGSMFVFEGLYDPEVGLVRSEDELAAVMAHEIAHVNCRHTTERLSKMLPLAVGAEVGAQVLLNNDEQAWANALRVAFAGGTALLIPTYSRMDEYEADRIGIQYMARAGYDPRAAPAIWRRVAEDPDSHDSTSIFATHPSSRDRWQALEKEIPRAMETYRQATGSYPEGYSP